MQEAAVQLADAKLARMRIRAPFRGVRPAGPAAASPWLAYAAFAAAFVIVLIAVAMKLHWKP